MKKYFLVIFVFTFTSIQSQDSRIPLDTTVVTNNEVVINGQKITYKATTGMQPVWDDHGDVIASLYYTYYRRTNLNLSLIHI